MRYDLIREGLDNWREVLKIYQKPDTRKALIQLLNSFIPFLALWVLMYFSLNWSYLFTILLAVINAFFLVRIFVIQHDCGHRSFLKSPRWNNLIGLVASFFSTIPFRYWRQTHNFHHAHNGQLENRRVGDIIFLTTEEYRDRSKWGKFTYRIFRSPLVQFVISPIIYLTITMRYPFIRLKGWKKIRSSYFINQLLLLLVYGILATVIGWQSFLLIHIPILLMFGMIAFWFFYIQHQHEDNYKEPRDKWEHLLASIRGSTYYKLPQVFQWLSGNIGFHHIHHLNSRIPNYHLAVCANENPILNQFVNVLTFGESLKCIHYKLWDQEKKRMISFNEYRKMAKGSTSAV